MSTGESGAISVRDRLTIVMHSCGNGIGRVYAKSQIKKAKRSTYLPDRTLDPQIQLSQLDSIFWLSPEHHVGFRRLMRVFFSHKTSALESAVASFLHVHGSLLWPDSPESRHHLSPSNNPISASYFDVMIKPTYSVQGGWQDLEEDDSWLNMQEESRMCSRIS